MTFLRTTWLAILLLPVPCLLAVVSERDTKDDPIVGEPLVYKTVGDRELHLYVVKPADWKASDRRPAAVFFHGGGWFTGSVSQFNDQSEYLASRGMVCVQVEYRLVGKKSKEPPTVCCQDAKSAMRYVRSHAGELGIDSDRIAAGGGSAGGHLAAFVGMVPGIDDPRDDLAVSPRADALLLFYPAVDNGPTDGVPDERMGDRYEEFSPAAHVEAGGPTAIIFHGRADRRIPVAKIEKFQTDLKAAGVRCDAFLYDGEGHGFANAGPCKIHSLVETDKFLASLGWLEGPPTLEAPTVAGVTGP